MQLLPFEAVQADIVGNNSTVLASGTQRAGNLGAVLLQPDAQCCMPPNQHGRSQVGAVNMGQHL